VFSCPHTVLYGDNVLGSMSVTSSISIEQLAAWIGKKQVGPIAK